MQNVFVSSEAFVHSLAVQFLNLLPSDGAFHILLKWCLRKYKAVAVTSGIQMKL